MQHKETVIRLLYESIWNYLMQLHEEKREIKYGME